MEPIRYVDALNAHYAAAGHPPYQWSINDSAPLHRLTKPLSACTVTLLTSGGISQCSMPAFDPMARNDHRVDAIDRNVVSTDFQIHDAYYDHRDADRDINCQFPIDRLRELARDGEIGAVARALLERLHGPHVQPQQAHRGIGAGVRRGTAQGSRRHTDRGTRLTARSPDRGSGMPRRRRAWSRDRVRLDGSRSDGAGEAAAQRLRQSPDGQCVRRAWRHRDADSKILRAALQLV